MYFSWSSEYELDIREIDEQHKHFVDILNNLYETILGLGDKKALLEELVAYASEHFDTEEKYFDLFKFDGASEHKEKHRELKEKVLDFQDKFKKGEKDISEELIDFLEDWLVDHLASMDKKYVACFKEHGLK